MHEFKFWLNLQEGLALKGGFKGSWFQRLVAAITGLLICIILLEPIEIKFIGTLTNLT